MRSTLNRLRSARNADHDGLPFHVTREQVTPGPERRGAGDLNGETRCRYDIDPGDTVEAIVCALILAPLSVALVALGALIRMATR